MGELPEMPLIVTLINGLDDNGVPAPYNNYVNLIKGRRSPYREIAEYILLEMANHYRNEGRSEVVYAINPGEIHENIEGKLKEKFG